MLLELGQTGLKQFGGYIREEFLRDLSGPRGMRVYREMRDNDPVIGAMMFAIEMLLRSVEFRVEGASPAGPDQQAADHVESCLTDMETSWPDTISEILTFLLYGWSLHEVVYKVRAGETVMDENGVVDPRYLSQYDDGMIGWRKLPIRAQETLLRWDVSPTGSVRHMIQLLPTGGPLLWIPLAKSMLFRTSVHKGNPEGRSILRNCYRPWYFKKRIEEIEAVGVERDLCGIPVMQVPSRITRKNAKPEEKAFYQEMKSLVRNLRNDEQAGVVIPQEYDTDKNPLFKLELLSTAGRRQFDTTAIVDRYDYRMMATILADFIMLGQRGQSGNRAMSKNKSDIFSVALGAILDTITAQFNRDAIPDLLKINGLPGRVKLTHGQIERRDLDDFGNFLLHAAQAGMLTPDPVTEAHVREMADLPPPDQEAMRDLDDGGEASGEGESQPDDPGDAGGQAAAVSRAMKAERMGAILKQYGFIKRNLPRA